MFKLKMTDDYSDLFTCTGKKTKIIIPSLNSYFYQSRVVYFYYVSLVYVFGHSQTFFN